MSMQAFEEAIRRAAELIGSARHGIALTGAGISTPSGIPDFRSPQSGLWNLVDPYEVASLLAFRRSPDRFYEWLRPLASLIFEASPNAAHRALTRLQQGGFLTSIVTQNIDGLHQKSGTRNVFEVHGTISHLTCVSCFKQVESSDVISTYLEAHIIPRCPNCGSVLKVDVILFDEQLPLKAWLQAEEAVNNCDLMIVAGSSLEVYPVSRLPLDAIEHGARLIIINFTPTYLDTQADVVIPGDVADILPEIAEEVLLAKN